MIADRRQTQISTRIRLNLQATLVTTAPSAAEHESKLNGNMPDAVRVTVSK